MHVPKHYIRIHFLMKVSAYRSITFTVPGLFVTVIVLRQWREDSPSLNI